RPLASQGKAAAESERQWRHSSALCASCRLTLSSRRVASIIYEFRVWPPRPLTPRLLPSLRSRQPSLLSPALLQRDRYQTSTCPSCTSRQTRRAHRTDCLCKVISSRL